MYKEEKKLPTNLKKLEDRKEREKDRERKFSLQVIKEIPVMKKKVEEFLKKDRLFQRNRGNAFWYNEIYKAMGFEAIKNGNKDSTPKSDALAIALKYFKENPDNPEKVKYSSEHGFYCEES